MHILVTRPYPAAGRTAARLAERGHVAIVAPTLTVEPSGEAMPPGEFDALVLTSANALVAFDDPPDRLPVLTVGDRTAEAARKAGFQDVRSAVGDRQALALLAQETLPPGQRLLVVTGRHRKDDLAELLAHAGHEPVIWTAYVAEAKPRLPEAAREALVHGPLDGLLHYSRRSATISLALARQAGLGDAFRDGFHACLSEDVAAPLRAAGVKRLAVAEAPDEDSLFDALETRAGSL
jgi:uroporphyrinogen-III synthase